MSDTLPENWVLAGIGDLVEMNPKNYVDDDLMTGFVPLQLLGKRFRDRHSYQARPWREIKKGYTHFANGDVLLARITPSFENGKAGIVRDLPNGIGAGSTEYFVCRPIPEVLISEYLLAFFKTREFLINGEQLMSGAVGQQRVPKSYITETQIPLAPLSEQKRIADKLDSLLAKVDACRERLGRVPQILKRFRQSVLAAAVSGRLTEDWREQHASIESASKAMIRVFARRRHESKRRPTNLNPPGELIQPQFADNYRAVKGEALPDLPQTWAYAHLPEVGYMNRGTSRHRPRNASHLYGGAYPFVQTGDIARSGGRITNHQQTYSDAGLKQSRLWPASTICVTIAANIADSAILTYPACFPDSVVGILADNELALPEYIEYFIRTARQNLAAYAPATAQANINMAILNEVHVPVPPLLEQQEIVRRVDLLFNFAHRLEGKWDVAVTALEAFTPSLLQKAFQGELVPQDPEDESADMLIARIGERGNTSEGTKTRPPKVNSVRPPTRKEHIMLSRKEVPAAYLRDILRARGPLTPEGLWNASKLDVDDFYDVLREEEAGGLLKEIRDDDANDPPMVEAA